MNFEQALSEVQQHVNEGGFLKYAIGKNQEIGRFIDVMSVDGYWIPSPFWQEFHEEYFENASGF